MSHKKPVSILVAHLKTAQKYGFFNKKSKELTRKYWPGALTIVVKRKKTLPLFFNKGSKSIGIRVPHHNLSLKLVQKFGRPLTTTSANINTFPSTYSVSEIRKQFKNEKNKPDFIINSGGIPKNSPSTIVDVSGKKIKVIRQGAIIL